MKKHPARHPLRRARPRRLGGRHLQRQAPTDSEPRERGGDSPNLDVAASRRRGSNGSQVSVLREGDKHDTHRDSTADGRARAAGRRAKPVVYSMQGEQRRRSGRLSSVEYGMQTEKGPPAQPGSARSRSPAWPNRPLAVRDRERCPPRSYGLCRAAPIRLPHGYRRVGGGAGQGFRKLGSCCDFAGCDLPGLVFQFKNAIKPFVLRGGALWTCGRASGAMDHGTRPSASWLLGIISLIGLIGATSSCSSTSSKRSTRRASR